MNGVRQAFDRAAHRYDAYAEQQREVCEKLATLAAPYRSDWLLDVGCGTGYLKAYTGWPVVGCDLAYGMCREAAKHNQPVMAADLHQLPLPTDSIPMIFSSLALQWSDDPAQAFSEWKRVSVYLSPTLNELYESFNLIDEVPPLRWFLSNAQVIDMINCAGFNVQSSQVELLTREDNTLIDLVSYMKKIGASQSAQRAHKTRGDWQRLEDAYPKKNGKIVSTWQVGYYLLRNPA